SAPIETRMSVEDHHPAHQHDEDGEGVDPVPKPRRKAMAFHDVPAARPILRLRVACGIKWRDAHSHLPSTVSQLSKNLSSTAHFSDSLAIIGDAGTLERCVILR